uniref:G_PROTEIN_RECEP_F1_2 domain-containing protein n=1 Tax=Macrostomum lignano TaxID=282301 RepID=A0A1I8IRX6_9PLAT
VRITDFGLARLLNISERDFASRGGLLPMKWLGLECIESGLFSHQSDVWSYGVLLWEVCTFGESPYCQYGIRSAEDMLGLLRKGIRLGQPDVCSVDFYNILLSCWLPFPEESRPSFSDLTDTMKDCLKAPEKYIAYNAAGTREAGGATVAASVNESDGDGEGDGEGETETTMAATVVAADADVGNNGDSANAYITDPVEKRALLEPELRDPPAGGPADAAHVAAAAAARGRLRQRSMRQQLPVAQAKPPNRDPLTFAKTVMYDLERGLNAYKYKWSGTDPEPQFLRKEKSSEEEATTGLPTEDSSSSCAQPALTAPSNLAGSSAGFSHTPVQHFLTAVLSGLLHDSMQTGQKSTAPPALVAYIIMASIIAVGAAGNSIVLYVYAKKKDGHAANVFILSLAVSDLLACTLVIPMTVAMEARNYETSALVCRLHYLLNCSGIPFSSMLMAAIAVERYFCICKPFLRAITVRRAKAIVATLVAVAVTLGATTASGNSPATGECREISDLSDGPSMTVSRASLVFYRVFQAIHLSLYLLCIVLVFILYVLIYESVLRLRRRRRQRAERMNKRMQLAAARSAGGPPTRATPWLRLQPPLLAMTLRPRPLLPLSAPRRTNCKQRQQQQQQQQLSLVPSTSNSALAVASRDSRDSDALQNLKTAAMLFFVVAIVFILTFLPAALMTIKAVPFNIIVFY